jgi:hypothetical protein
VSRTPPPDDGMITTASGYPEVEMAESAKDLSPQQSLLTHSYDEEEFDLPQVRYGSSWGQTVPVRMLCACICVCTVCM